MAGGWRERWRRGGGEVAGRWRRCRKNCLLDGSVFLSILADLGGIEPYRHEIAQWYITLSKLQKAHPNHQPTVDFRATSSSSPCTHFVREKQLCLAYRLAFVIKLSDCRPHFSSSKGLHRSEPRSPWGGRTVRTRQHVLLPWCAPHISCNAAAKAQQKEGVRETAYECQCLKDL